MFVYIYNWWVKAHSGEFSVPAVMGIVAVSFVVLVGFAWLVMICWDRPVQRWLVARKATKSSS